MVDNNINHESNVGIMTVAAPIIASIIACILPGILALDYVHVLFGAIWTGSDVFLGMIFLIVLSGIENRIRSDIAKRLLPMTLFFIPTMTILTPLLGYVLALREGIFAFNFLFNAIIIISILLGLLTFIVIVPSSYKIYSGFKKGKTDVDQNGSLLMRIAKMATIQMILQIIIISLMAYIVVYL